MPDSIEKMSMILAAGNAWKTVLNLTTYGEVGKSIASDNINRMRNLHSTVSDKLMSGGATW